MSYNKFNLQGEIPMENKFYLIILLFVIIILSILPTGCSDDMSAAEKSVTKDKAELEIVYASGDRASSVTQNVTLATEGARITVITWSSSNTAIIANDGTITCPLYANGTVTLTATISKEDESDTKQFVLEVTNDPYNLSLRDTGPAGGWIFYINPNAAVDGWKYLEAALDDQSLSQVWIEGGSQTALNGNTNTGIGTGLANTNAIVLQAFNDGGGSSAAQICLDLTIDVYDDWFLPSKDELNYMYDGLHYSGVGGFADDNYWSSSEGNDSNAWFQTFFGGNQGYAVKNDSSWVRAVRAF
jgi:aBig family protein